MFDTNLNEYEFNGVLGSKYLEQLSGKDNNEVIDDELNFYEDSIDGNIDAASFYADYSQDCATQYLKQIGKYEVLTQEETIDLCEKIAKGKKAKELLALIKKTELDTLTPIEIASIEVQMEQLQKDITIGERARSEFIERNLKLAVHAVKERVANSPLEFIDLIQEANKGLIIAVDTFDYTVGVKFSTHAIYQIRAKMIRAEENNGRSIRLPSYLVQAKNKVNKAVQKLNLQGIEPTTELLSKETGLSLKRVQAALDCDKRMYSMNNEFGDRDSEGMEFFMSEDNTEENVMQKNLVERVRQVIQDCNLQEQELQVIKLRFFENKSLDYIGKKMHLSRERIHQIEKEAKSILKVAFKREGLDKFLS